MAFNDEPDAPWDRARAEHEVGRIAAIIRFFASQALIHIARSVDLQNTFSQDNVRPYWVDVANGTNLPPFRIEFQPDDWAV